MKPALALLLLALGACSVPAVAEAPEDAPEYAVSHHPAHKHAEPGRATAEEPPCVTEAGGAVVIAQNGKKCQ